MLRSSLFAQPAPSKWVRLKSSIVPSLERYPDGDAVGVSGLNCTMPNGTSAPGKVLPPAPPGTGLGALLSSVPMNGLTYCVGLATAARAGEPSAVRPATVRASVVIAIGRRPGGRWGRDLMALSLLKASG